MLSQGNLKVQLGPSVPRASTKQRCTPGTAPPPPSTHLPSPGPGRCQGWVCGWLGGWWGQEPPWGHWTLQGIAGTVSVGPPLGAQGGWGSLGDIWDVRWCAEGLTVGSGHADPCQLAAHQGHLQGHMLVPALGCDTDVAGDNGRNEGIGDLPLAVSVSFKDLPERVKRVQMATHPWAGGL